MICRFCFLRYFKFHPKASLSSALNVQESDTTGDEENYGSSLHTLISLQEMEIKFLMNLKEVRKAIFISSRKLALLMYSASQ